MRVLAVIWHCSISREATWEMYWSMVTERIGMRSWWVDAAWRLPSRVRRR